MESRFDAENADLNAVGDKQSFEEILRDDVSADADVPLTPKLLPLTLLEAMKDGTSYGRDCQWNALFRFVVRLRSAKGGCDTQWVTNALHARRCSRALNWHQYLAHMQVQSDCVASLFLFFRILRSVAMQNQ